MPKIKIFKFVPENAKAIEELLQTANILGEGLMITDGHLGIMYKDKGEVVTDKDGLINKVSEELIKAQKKFILGNVTYRVSSEIWPAPGWDITAPDQTIYEVRPQ